MNGCDMMVIPDIISKIGVMLNDSQSAVRILALETLIGFHHIFGDNLIVSLLIFPFLVC